MDRNDFEVEKEAKYDIVSQFTGMLSALLPVLAILGVNLNWFNEDFIDSLAVLLSSIIFFAINIYTIYKNHFSGEKAKAKSKALKEKGFY